MVENPRQYMLLGTGYVYRKQSVECHRKVNEKNGYPAGSQQQQQQQVYSVLPFCTGVSD